MKTRSCQQCGKPLDPASKQKQFCSPKCFYESKRAKKQKELGQCIICGKDRTSATAKNTCSAQCSYEARKRKTRRPKKCGFCGEEFWPDTGNIRKYCSSACYQAVHSQRLALITVVCENCKTEFQRTKAAVDRQDHSFCSRKCSNEWHRGDNHKWYRGGSDPNRGSEWRKISEAIRRRDSFTCQWCNTPESELGEKLSVDHIIPWREFDDKAEANDYKNLVSLCRSCHSKKTALEKRYLNGDRLALERYIRTMREAIEINSMHVCKCHETHKHRPSGIPDEVMKHARRIDEEYEYNSEETD